MFREFYEFFAETRILVVDSFANCVMCRTLLKSKHPVMVAMTFINYSLRDYPHFCGART